MTAALLWDLWRRGRWHLVVLGSGLTLFAALFLSVVPLDDPVKRQELGAGVLGIAILCLGIDLLHLAEGRNGEGADARAYVLPVSSARLAVTRMGALVGVMVLSYLVGGAALALWLGVPGPNGAAAALVAALMAWFVCAAWATPRQPVRRTLALVLLGALVAVPRMVWFPDAFARPPGVWEGAGPLELAALGLCLGAAFPAGIWAVARHRRGDAMPEGQRGASERPAATTPPPAEAFSSGFGALFWLDLREKGRLVPGLFGVPWVLLLLVQLSGLIDRQEVAAFVSAQVSFVLFLGPVLVAGIVCRVQEGRIGAGLDELRTLRPVSSARLAGVYLAHGALGLAVAWTLTAVGAAAVLTVAGGGPESAAAGLAARWPDELLPRLPALLLVLASAGWLQVGGLAALLLTGRNSAAALLIGIPYSAAGALLVFRDAITRLPGEELLAAAPWVVGGLGLCGTAGIFALALRRGLISPRAVAWQCAVAVALLAAAASALGPLSLARSFALYGCALAMLAPWPAASLAVRWNRHR